MKKAIAVILIFLSRPACAGSAGADPFNFLFLDAGARPVALGGAYTAVPGDVSSLLYNPASLAETGRDRQAMFMHNSYFQDISQEYLSYADPAGWGLSFNYLSFGTMRRTTVSNPSGEGLGSVSLTDMALSAGYGRALSLNLAGGAALKYVNEDVAGYTGRGFAMDLGLLYFPPWQPKLTLGASLQNLGPAVKFGTVKEKLPLNMRAGAVYRFMVRELPALLALDFSKARGEDLLPMLGLEVMAARGFPVRLGYSARNEAGPGVTFGAGYARGDLNFDYAFVPFGDLGAAHRFSAGLKWGAGARKSAKNALSKKEKALALKKAEADRTAAEYSRLLALAREKYTKDPDAAAAAYERAIALDGTDPRVDIALGDLLMKNNKPEEAEKVFAGTARKLAAGDERAAYIAERRGTALLRLEKYGAAKKQFKLALELAGDKRLTGVVQENAYYGLGYCLERDEDAEGAIASYKRALGLTANDALRKYIEKRLFMLEIGHR